MCVTNAANTVLTISKLPTRHSPFFQALSYAQAVLHSRIQYLLLTKNGILKQNI